MGGLVARCLIQKVYSPGEAERNISKLFTYGTPHGGIHFDIAGGGVLERLRDFIGFNDSDTSDPKKCTSSSRVTLEMSLLATGILGSRSSVIRL